MVLFLAPVRIGPFFRPFIFQHMARSETIGGIRPTGTHRHPYHHERVAQEMPGTRTGNRAHPRPPDPSPFAQRTPVYPDDVSARHGRLSVFVIEGPLPPALGG